MKINQLVSTSLFLGIMLVFVSCQSDEDTSNQRKMDYTDYTRHQFKKMGLEIKLPKTYTSFEYGDEMLDSLNQANAQEGKRDPMRAYLLASIYAQKENKLEMFVNHESENQLAITELPYTPIEPKLGGQLVGYYKSNLEAINRQSGQQFELVEKNMIVGGKINYMRFVVTGNDFSIQTYLITRGMKTWRMEHLGTDDLDYEAVLSSIRIVKSP
ncbi:hypothetical protein KFE98_13330 [bacterium SCSIO 12741]|nr:hypothetical protein KFE98_13330 [bacterium SCSIO 12741]